MNRSERHLWDLLMETPIATTVRESLHQVEEICQIVSLADVLLLDTVELMRRATLTSMDSMESPSTSRLEEVANTCALANE